MNKKQRDIILILGVIFILYIPTFLWLIGIWLEKDSHYSHGFLVPLISLFFVWKQRSILKPLEKKSAALVFALGLFLYAAGFLLKFPFISAVSFIVVLMGIIIYVYGKDVMLKLMFPVLFLFFMIPLYPSDDINIDSISADLQLFTAKYASIAAEKLGISVESVETKINLEGCPMVIGPVCSGITTLVTFITLAVLFIYIIETSVYKKMFILCLAVPIAIFANVLRIVVIIFIAQNYGCDPAMNFFHTFSGIFSFLIGVIILILAAFLIKSLKFREDIF